MLKNAHNLSYKHTAGAIPQRSCRIGNSFSGVTAVEYTTFRRVASISAGFGDCSPGLCSAALLCCTSRQSRGRTTCLYSAPIGVTPFCCGPPRVFFYETPGNIIFRTQPTLHPTNPSSRAHVPQFSVRQISLCERLVGEDRLGLQSPYKSKAIQLWRAVHLACDA